MNQPLYLQVADHFRQRILSGEMPPGTRLPSRPEIAAQFGVAEGVAHQATRALIAEGFLESRPGAGTFVKERPSVQRLVRSWYRKDRGGSPFRAEMEAQGKRGTWRYESETVQAPAAIRPRLALDEPDGQLPDVMRTRYVFLADDQPVMLSTSYEPYALTKGEPIVFPEDGPYAGQGVIDRMAVIGVQVTHCAEVVSARPLLAAEARDLAMPQGSLGMTIARTYYEDERPVETADIVIPVDKYEIVYGIPIRGEA